MALVYSEDWAAGNSLFDTVYYYERIVNGVDPLYPYMMNSEGVYINGDERLDANPVWTGEYQDYGTAGIWLKGMGGLSWYGESGYWDATTGCIECVYYPTTESIGEEGETNGCPLIELATAGGYTGLLGVFVWLGDGYFQVRQRNEGEHPDEVEIYGMPMPIAGQPYLVRLGWQCGTFDPVEEVTAADGYVRVWINDELIYEAIDISLWLTLPDVYMVGAPNLLDSVQFGFSGLLGPLGDLTIRDNACAPVSSLQFGSGVTETPLVWMEIWFKP